MDKSLVHIPQGGTLRLLPGEAQNLCDVFKSHGISTECIDTTQDVVAFPQAYVGYISLPNRKIVIDSKHKGINLKHIIRIYYFLYASDVTDLDDPIYDIESNGNVNVVKSYLKELDHIVKKGLPVEYISRQDNLQYLRGNVNIVNTMINKRLGRRDLFDCSFDSLTHDIAINQVLYKALLKTKQLQELEIVGTLEKNFIDVTNVSKVPATTLFTNTMYCKKALSLAYMIINDLSVSDYGNQTYGQNLLLNFDKIFEQFIKKILTVYSGDYNFTYWEDERSYAVCRNGEEEYYKSYIPDMLYGYQETESMPSAFAILDMKNKTSTPFSNADVYQMFFYANQLKSKKVILCYPSAEEKENALLKFNSEDFALRKIHAAFINIAGETSLEFKQNIYSFIEKVQGLL